MVNKISILNSGSESLQKALISVAVLFIITLLIGWGFHWCTLVRKAKFVSSKYGFYISSELVQIQSRCPQKSIPRLYNWTSLNKIQHLYNSL